MLSYDFPGDRVRSQFEWRNQEPKNERTYLLEERKKATKCLMIPSTQKKPKPHGERISAALDNIKGYKIKTVNLHYFIKSRDVSNRR